MRKIILSVCFCAYALISSAQISCTGKIYTNNQDVDYVVLFNGISSTSEISYTGSGTIVNWYKFTDTSTSINNTKEISPDDATGYILEVDGVRKTIWAIDYSLYSPVSLELDNSSDSPCENIALKANVPTINYKTLAGVSHPLTRNFKLTYKSKKWDNEKWSDDAKSLSVNFPATDLLVPAPLCDTEFTLTGDQYADDLNIVPAPLKTALYDAIAVKCYPTSNLTLRTEKNEAEYPKDKSQLIGSAPLEILFQSNANEPVAKFYKWEIFKAKQLLVTRTDKDHRYTFTESGDYKVKLLSSNPFCNDTASIEIKVTESALYVPNVFTPDGNGINDQFRVAYKSLASFNCWVYNRWGRKVFSWSDPQKGWDGTINGKKASPGAYFYVINAVGSDGVKYTRKGDINLLRGKEN